MNVFVDTCIINRVLDLESSSPDPKWEEDRKYLQRLVNGPVVCGGMTLFVNPSVISQLIMILNRLRQRRTLAVVFR